MSIFKLTTESESSADHEEYARALRAIGQDLANLFPENLEIELSGDTYTAHCRGRGHPAQVSKGHETTLVKKPFETFLHKKSSATPVVQEASLIPIHRKYTPQDIDRIDGLHIDGRNRPGRTPDLHSLGERLRTIGRIVHSKQGHLLKVVNDKNCIKFQYRDPTGAVQTEEISHLTLYKLQQAYYSQRGTKPIKDVWGEIDR